MELQNSESALNSTVKTVTLLEDLPGSVESLSILDTTNMSISLMWSPPTVMNGIISGYSIYVNNGSVSIILQCVCDDKIKCLCCH